MLLIDTCKDDNLELGFQSFTYDNDIRVQVEYSDCLAETEAYYVNLLAFCGIEIYECAQF